ncbi:MAG: DNA polymerase domain-containing protein [Nanoarchaeota archaeon]
MWLLDAYRKKEKIVLWLKTGKGSIKIEKPFAAVFYVEKRGKHILDKLCLDYQLEKKKDYLGKVRYVYEVPVFNLNNFENIVSKIEKLSRHTLTLYNADITPEQQFLFYHNLYCGKYTDIKTLKQTESEICLTRCYLSYEDNLILNDRECSLEKFAKEFQKQDPDVILMQNGFSRLPKLYEDLKAKGIICPFHRWDATFIKYKGGKSFFSYGRVIYHDFAIRLWGRFLVDTNSVIGGECDVEGIMELCRLTGAQFQQIASRSFGAAFQFSLVRLLYQKNYLVPYKEKPVDIPLSMYDLLKGDRGGHTFDSITGFHKNVAEIDFTSMFPFIIYNKNISAETILNHDEPREKVPNLPFSVSKKEKGIVPMAIKPLLKKRMEYKKNPNHLNKKRTDALKMVLVTAYGYLRFREFKLGVATSHMAICSYAREIILEASKMAENRGFKVVHGIIDSLYIKKTNITEEEVKDFCEELTQKFGIPADFEGMFKWIVFLPSINDISRPLPACYYGAFNDKTIKARGIEVRERKTPKVVKIFQQKILEAMSECSSKKEILGRVKEFCVVLRQVIQYLPNVKRDFLTHNLRISTTDYKHNTPQKQIVEKLKKQGKVYPGQRIEYIIENKGQNKNGKGSAVLLNEYSGKCDIDYYKKLLTRSLFNILQPLGISYEKILQLSSLEKQTLITDYYPKIKFVYIRMKRNYKYNRGLSEKIIKKRLEGNNWIVWRGGCINILREDGIYPNVYNKYSKLISLLKKYYPGIVEYLQYLCSVHHGMPDFLCFRDGKFKFVECKFRHESLSGRQKKCIQRLLDIGFVVEVHKLVGPETKTREAVINIRNNEKKIISKQKMLKGY